MTISPYELQSQVLPIFWASGRVLVAGLGLGYVVNEMIKKPSVKEVWVIESSLDVIEIYTKLFSKKRGFKKINFVHDDILKVKLKVDFAYFDIWPDHDFLEVIKDMKKIKKNIIAKKYAVWGMELYSLANIDPPLFLKEKEIQKIFPFKMDKKQIYDIYATCIIGLGVKF